MALQALAAPVAIEVDLCAVEEPGAVSVGVGRGHVHDERRALGSLVGEVALVRRRHVGDVVTSVLEAVALPVSRARREAGVHASVLEAHRHDLLALRELEV